MGNLTKQTEKAQLEVILKIIHFKTVVLNGDEERVKTEEELKKALRGIGLGEKLIEYLIYQFKRAAEMERVYEKVKETIRELHPIL
jgi:hypothetical protein